MKKASAVKIFFLVLLMFFFYLGNLFAAPGDTTRVSVDSSGNESNNTSDMPSISADGRFVTFYSNATNLVSADTNGLSDIFVRDTQTHVTTLVSLGMANAPGNGASYDFSSISADGKYVAFMSFASNLVPGDTNNRTDVFVRDLPHATTSLVSIGMANIPSNHVSTYPFISANGKFVVFTSFASNLVPGDINGKPDIFVRDLLNSTTTRVSVNSAGEQGNGSSYGFSSISAGGRFVVFRSQATNLVSGDSNGKDDVFVRDLQNGTTTLVSVGMANAPADGFSVDPFISADGRYVVFRSAATNLVPGDTNGKDDIFVRDLQNGTTSLVSIGIANVSADGSSVDPSISTDGRYVAFRSAATNLVPGDSNSSGDIFVRDLQDGITTRVSVDSANEQGNQQSFNPYISAGGESVAFASWSDNLVPADTNGEIDVFVHEYLAASAPPTSSADLVLIKTATPNPVEINAQQTFTLQVTNNGPDDASGVTIVDTLPAGMTFVSASSGCSEVGGVVTCNIGNLAASASTAVQIVVTAPIAPASLSNMATVAAAETDPDMDNNTATVDIAVLAPAPPPPGADLVITQTASNSVDINSQQTFMLQVTNNGPDDASGVTIVDTLPAGMTLVSASSGCSATGGIVTCNIGNLAASASTAVQIVATAPAGPASLANTAVVSAVEADPDMNNNSAVYNFSVVNNNAIPTLSEWGMIIFSLLMTGFACWFIRRQDRGIV